MEELEALKQERLNDPAYQFNKTSLVSRARDTALIKRRREYMELSELSILTDALIRKTSKLISAEKANITYKYKKVKMPQVMNRLCALITCD